MEGASVQSIRGVGVAWELPSWGVSAVRQLRGSGTEQLEPLYKRGVGESVLLSVHWSSVRAERMGAAEPVTGRS